MTRCQLIDRKSKQPTGPLAMRSAKVSSRCRKHSPVMIAVSPLDAMTTISAILQSTDSMFSQCAIPAIGSERGAVGSLNLPQSGEKNFAKRCWEMTGHSAISSHPSILKSVLVSVGETPEPCSAGSSLKSIEGI